MKKVVLFAVVLGLAATGCATKKFVNTGIGEVNKKVDTLSGEVEKTQARVKSTDARVDAVDGKAQAAQAGANEAKGAASAANGAAAAAMTKAQEAEKAAKGKLIYTVTLSNDKVTFPLNVAEISADAKKVVDEAIAPIVAANRNVFFEVEGHTDAAGDESWNQKLGEDRAMAVRTYLHDQHNIPLSRIEIISYGESKPVADNKTREGRSQNRRVVIKVVE